MTTDKAADSDVEVLRGLLERVEHDPEALELVARLVELLAARADLRRSCKEIERKS